MFLKNNHYRQDVDLDKSYNTIAAQSAARKLSAETKIRTKLNDGMQ